MPGDRIQSKNCFFGCGKNNPVFMKYCYNCGRLLPKRCEKGHFVDGNNSSCNECYPTYKFPKVKWKLLILVFQDFPFSIISITVVILGFWFEFLLELNDLILFFLLFISIDFVKWTVSFNEKNKKIYRTPLKINLLIGFIGLVVYIFFYLGINTDFSSPFLFITIFMLMLFLYLIFFHDWIRIKHKRKKSQLWSYTIISKKLKNRMREFKRNFKEAKMNPDSIFFTFWWGKKVVRYKESLLNDMITTLALTIFMSVLMIATVISIFTIYTQKIFLFYLDFKIFWLLILIITLVETFNAYSRYKGKKLKTTIRVKKEKDRTIINYISFFMKDLSYKDYVYVSIIITSIITSFVFILQDLERLLVIFIYKGVIILGGNIYYFLAFIEHFIPIIIYLNFIIILYLAFKNMIGKNELIIKNSDILTISAPIFIVFTYYLLPSFRILYIVPLIILLKVIYIIILSIIIINYLFGKFMKKKIAFEIKYMILISIIFLVFSCMVYLTRFVFQIMALILIVMFFLKLGWRYHETISYESPTFADQIYKRLECHKADFMAFSLVIVCMIIAMFLFPERNKRFWFSMVIIIVLFYMLIFFSKYSEFKRILRIQDKEKRVKEYYKKENDVPFAGMDIFFDINELKNKFNTNSETYKKALQMDTKKKK